MVTARIAAVGALIVGLGAFSYSAFAHARAATGPSNRFRPHAAAKTLNATATAAGFNLDDALTRSGVGAAKVEGDNYVVEAKADAGYKATLEGTFEVSITAKGNYHINPQFPIRWKSGEAPENVTYSKPVLTRDDGTFKETSGSFKVPFSASKAGKYTVGGSLSVSFCSEKNCLMEKVPVDIDVTVK